MSEIQQTRYDQVLRRVCGLLGPGSKVSDALSELFPMISVEQLPGELLVLGGTVSAFGSFDLTAAAGQFARIGVRNPTGSENIITVTSMFVAVTTSQTIAWGHSASTLANLQNNQRPRDTRRIGLNVLPLGEIRSESAIAVPTSTGRTRLIAQTPFLIHDPDGLAILLPGRSFDVAGVLAASRLLATFYWRERPAQQSELNL